MTDIEPGDDTGWSDPRRRLAELRAAAARFRDAYERLHQCLGEDEGAALLDRCEALRAEISPRRPA